ncbi:MAG: copper amine oxidase N-terminal domain-containing protein [Firmicutes bacterium]|nr:copper amine oxidase N-terminal domain-containing protein [Bacillota bacterium]
MKRMKTARRLAAMLIVAAMTLGAAAFAVSAEDFKDLSYTSAQFTGGGNALLGSYPTATGIGGLDQKIYTKVINEYAAYQSSTSFNVIAPSFGVSFKPANNGQYATIVLTFAGDPPYVPGSVTYYIDKTAAKEIDKAAYDAGVAAAEAAPATDEKAPATDETAPATDETAPSDGGAEVAPDNGGEDVAPPAEIVMVQLRQYAVPLGYALAWDGSTKTVTVSMGDFSATMVIGVDKYTVNGESVSLGAAPKIQDDFTMVPLSFFEEVLGCTASADADGNYVITLAE